MGRGRAKAKQQKVARELKYNTHSTDFSALQRELGHSNSDHDAYDDPDRDPYADDDEDEDWTPSR